MRFRGKLRGYSFACGAFVIGRAPVRSTLRPYRERVSALSNTLRSSSPNARNSLSCGMELYSQRMEEEKRRSEQARINANKRYQKEPAVQSAVPLAVLCSDSDINSGFGIRSAFVLEENARARETVCEVCGGQRYFDVAPNVKGPRLIPCPKCCGQVKTLGASA